MPRKARDLVNLTAQLMLLFAIGIVVVGYWNTHKASLDLGILISELWANIGTELASIAITILVIGKLQQRALDEQQRKNYILQMGSANRDIAAEAVRLIKVNAWGDSSSSALHGAQLANANLMATDLSKLSMKSICLDHARLNDSDLSNSDLSGSSMLLTKMRNMTLIETNLTLCNLNGCDLSGSQIVDVNLSFVRMHFATLAYVKLTATTLSNSKLANSKFMRTTISGADFSKCELTGCDFSNAQVIDCKFIHADLSETDFSGADLSLSDFSYACLAQVDFTNACLKNVRLNGVVGLSEDQLRSAKSLFGAIMPDGTPYDGRYQLYGDNDDTTNDDVKNRQLLREHPCSA